MATAAIHFGVSVYFREQVIVFRKPKCTISIMVPRSPSYLTTSWIINIIYNMHVMFDL